jgi:hypothetical protein
MQKIMKRLITFGDSFANYVWPMWPELLAQDYDETLNYGRSGCGNSYIFNSFMTHHLTKGFSHTDTVIIEWTEPTRVDFIKDGDWVTEGNKTVESLMINDLDYFLSDQTVVLNQLTMMVSVIQFLANSGCNWYFMFLNEASMPHRVSADFILHQTIINRYDAALKFINEFNDHIIDNVSMSEFFGMSDMPIQTCKTYFEDGQLLEFKDSHPTPAYTLKFIEQILSKKLKIENIEVIKKFAEGCQQEIEIRKDNGVINQMTLAKFIKNYIDLNNYKQPIYQL